MNFKFFPDKEPLSSDKDYKDAAGDVGREIDKLSKGDQELFARVQSALNKLKQVRNLDVYFKLQWIKPFGGLYELRIPPTRNKGVFRIYFCFDLKNSETLILLCAEVKHKKKPMKEETAKKKYREYLEKVKNGEM